MTEWSVEDKVFGITLDNASVNDSMVNFVKSNLLGWELLVGKGEMLHHRCAAHVLNLMVQDGLKVGSAAINNIRESVLFVRSSEARRQKFKDIVAQEGIEYEKSVCLDVTTRWNSTYLMMKTILVFKRAFDALDIQDPAYLCAPSAEQWNLAREMVTLLEVFYNDTVVFSGSLKFMKYWKLMYLTICVPVILDLRFKYEYLEYQLKDDAEIEGQTYMIAVKRAFKELFNAYSSCDDGPSVDVEVMETSVAVVKTITEDFVYDTDGNSA
ncbi:zinc finger BED domain-containing protein RICESLEEPER 2 [Brachypodium distachyon]|uniref:zinc finger BED domain-containing protein RICESLEEPER 2 n=1 Tax=Brachypodium distachyon TaxID=15368 RepID=UPI00052FE86A|nr:zinc finger BED domain-containing protein RICESLEEPER 2 [Brachypodium distachyon]|eukprot:XP_010236899.1 zinc finger BED domain-containing protein RICESLEEPER 2 [Brachypodium distachyon]